MLRNHQRSQLRLEVPRIDFQPNRNIRLRHDLTAILHVWVFNELLAIPIHPYLLIYVANPFSILTLIHLVGSTLGELDFSIFGLSALWGRACT